VDGHLKQSLPQAIHARSSTRPGDIVHVYGYGLFISGPAQYYGANVLAAPSSLSAA
jgi:hypothetical protein